MVLLFGLILVSMGGCSKQNSNSSIDPNTGKHSVIDWANADIHGAWAKKPSSEGGFASCQECHGSDFSGGNSKKACSLCHGVSAPHPGTGSWASASGVRTHQNTDETNAPVCAGCHANGANSPLGPLPPTGAAPGCFNSTLCHGAGHPAGWAAADQHGASAKAQASGFSGCQSCHGIDFAGGTATISCFTCHGVNAPHPPTPWITSATPTLTHTTTNEGNAAVCAGCHTGGANLTSIPTPTPTPPAGTPAGCFNNTLCHAQIGHAAGWSSADVHGAAAKLAPSGAAMQGFSKCQECHGLNFAGGTATTCLNTGICHGPGVDSPHAFPWQSTSTRKHSTTAEANATACGLCHLANRQPPSYVPLAQAVGCFDNTLCHAAAGSLGCIDCHNVAQPTSAATQALPGGSGVTQRVAIEPSFSLASSHIRSRGGAVTNNDCGVCHMEGNTADGSINATYHRNGYIELRDPDTGVTIKGVTHSGTTSAEGVYTSTGTDARPVQFSRNLGSAAIEADTAAIMVNQCLKCHDAGGAASASAVVPGGTAGQPFAGAITANPGSNVLDVAAQFAPTNRSFHPVTVRQNSGYTNTGGTRMIAPWNGVTKTATTTVYGPLITCWDCHAPNGTGAVTLTTSGIHGGAVNGADVVPLRGNVYTAGTTAASNLCLHCHVVSGGTTNHGTGSAITSSTNGSMTYFQNRCTICHGSQTTTAHAPRPVGAGDAHGFSTRSTGAAFPAASNGYAFIRSEGWYAGATTHVVRQVGASTFTSNCGGYAGICNRGSMGNYAPGGVY